MAFAAERPDVVRYDAQYLNHSLVVHVEWQSPNPVTKVSLSAGNQNKEIQVDEYDNRRNPYGYQGEATVELPLNPVSQQAVPYVIQLEDDLHQKSRMLTDQVAMQPAQPSFPNGQPAQDDNWGRNGLSAMSGQQGAGAQQGVGGFQSVGGFQGVGGQQPAGSGGATGMVNTLVGLYDKFDLPPVLDALQTNVLSPDSVSFASRAADDKSLLEIRIKVYSAAGTLVGFQSLSGLGKSWQGSSQIFKLGGGKFRVSAQAIDNAGNTSKEQTAQCELSGQQIDLPAVQETTPIAPTAQPQTGQPANRGY